MELLVVIAIIGIILGVAIPRLHRSADGAKLKTTTQSIVNLLETAKGCAMGRHEICFVEYDGDRTVFLSKVDEDDLDNDGDTADRIQFEQGIKIPSGVHVVLTADNRVGFTPWGSVKDPDNPDNENDPSNAIVVTSATLGKSKTVTIVLATGYVEVT